MMKCFQHWCIIINFKLLVSTYHVIVRKKSESIMFTLPFWQAANICAICMTTIIRSILTADVILDKTDLETNCFRLDAAGLCFITG